MKRYNERIINATKIMSRKTLKKSMDKVNDLTHPSKDVSRVGSEIGKTIGVGLIITGTAGTLYGHMWGIGTFIAGAVTIYSNKINLERNK